jgi:hypothetical protein
MEGKLCHPCKQQGRLVAAAFVLPNGSGRCAEHWRQELGIPKKKIDEEEITVAKKPEQETIDAIRKDAADGMNMNQISEKHGVTWATAKKYSGGAGVNGKRRSCPPRTEIAINSGRWLRRRAEAIARAA